MDGTFVGALTGVVPPALNNPPGVKSILFDLTIEEQFTGGFADLGITIFGFQGGNFGLQQQFTDLVGVGGLSPGTYPGRQNRS